MFDDFNNLICLSGFTNPWRFKSWHILLLLMERSDHEIRFQVNQRNPKKTRVRAERGFARAELNLYRNKVAARATLSIFIICTIRGGACHLIRRDCSHKVAPADTHGWHSAAASWDENLEIWMKTARGSEHYFRLRLLRKCNSSLLVCAGSARFWFLQPAVCARERASAPGTQEPIMNDIIIIAAMNSRLFLHRIGWDYEYANRADKTLLHQRRAAAKEGELAAPHQPERIITNLGARAAGGRATVACQPAIRTASASSSSCSQRKAKGDIQ